MLHHRRFSEIPKFSIYQVDYKASTKLGRFEFQKLVFTETAWEKPANEPVNNKIVSKVFIMYVLFCGSNWTRIFK